MPNRPKRDRTARSTAFSIPMFRNRLLTRAVLYRAREGAAERSNRNALKFRLALEIATYRKQHNYAAYRAHRKRPLKLLRRKSGKPKWINSRFSISLE
jgi:hypothetical protein